MELLQPFIVCFIVVLFFSAFVKCATTFSILRYGLGLSGSGIGIVLLIISFAISMFVITPQVESVGGFSNAIPKNGMTLEEVSYKYTPMLEKYTDKSIKNHFEKLALQIKKKHSEDENANISLGIESKFQVLVASYLITEVKEAFEIGIFLLVPFFVLDLIVANVLLLIGATNLNQNVVALPLKLLLFFVVDGWQLITEKLISTYI